MSTWVQIGSENIVNSVLEYDGESSEWLVEKFGGEWIQSNQPAGPSIPEIGKTWHPDLNVFLWEKPFDSWVYSPEAKDWLAPVDYPGDGQSYIWDEASGSWVANGS